MERGFIKKLFERLKKDRSSLNERLKSLKIEEGKGSERAWSIYDLGAKDKNDKEDEESYCGYFGEGRESFARILPFEDAKYSFDQLSKKTKELGRKSLALDVMGQGRIGFDLGAEKSVGWTYKDQPIENLEGREIREGDLFDEKVLEKHFEELDRLVDSEGYDLNAVFFRAAGGFYIYYYNLFALSLLYEKVFTKIYSRMKTGGRMYLSIPDYGSGDKGASYVEKLMGVLRGMGYWITTDNHGLYVLEKSADKTVLPSIKEIMRINPLVTEKTLEIKGDFK
jgi:hypothetical protein